MEHDTEYAPRDSLNSRTVFPSMINSWCLLYVFNATFVILFRMQTEDIVLLPTHCNNDFLSSSKGSQFCYRANTKSCKGTRLFFCHFFFFDARQEPPNMGTAPPYKARHSLFQSKKEDCVTIFCSLGLKTQSQSSSSPFPLFNDPTKLCEVTADKYELGLVFTLAT